MTTSLNKSLVFLIVLIGLLIHPTAKAQEDLDLSQYRLRFGFTCTKQPNNSRVFKAEFYASNRKDRKEKVPVFGAEVRFFNILEDQEVEMGIAQTSQEGIAEITVPADYLYLTDEEGFMNFRALFKGSEAMDTESEELRIQDLQLKLNFAEVDSVRSATVKALTTDSLGVEIPVSDAYVILSVDGMLSRMVFQEDIIEDGELQIEFPQGLPGDPKGNITVYAVIEDDDNFGNVLQKQTIGWGTPQAERIQASNTLWSDVAPFWMYIVLTVLLLGVWANFVYTIINLTRIKKIGKKMALQEENPE
ncbi:MAG: hypothetical protein HKP23_05150 [Flavobacteriaceae bacterium]|nr:hypothetical protein [Eudoraea sp.]NNJ38613.1 hypothetical protein [Flavobacteriaceae bacterium]